MSSTEINKKEFINYVHAKFKSKIELDKLKEILNLEEDYNKDNPISLGKSLTLNRLIFSGEKLNGDKFTHDQLLYKGVNLWIADNMKGKSTIFKIVKYSLTGVESIKADIKNWIDEIILEFQIGKAVYTIHIDKTGRDKGALYSFGLDEFLENRDNNKLELIESKKEFDFKSKTMLEEQMEKFFFDHFSYYKLKYTHKSSVKEDTNLVTANLSWATYFKSIYLESSNYEYLFFENEKYGAQGRKIFEMILGLPLTYPINRLTVQSDGISEKIGKLNLVDQSKGEMTKAEKLKIQNEKDDIEKKLNLLNEQQNIQLDDKPLVDEYNKIKEQLNENRKKSRDIQTKREDSQAKFHIFGIEIENFKSDQKKIEDEVNRLEKQRLNLELYKETGSFFSNLEIKSCPHCDHIVTDEKKATELKNKECSLCGEVSNVQKIDQEELLTKLKKVIDEKKGHEKKYKEIDTSIAEHTKDKGNLKNSINSLSNELVKIPLEDKSIIKLNEIEDKIEELNKERRSKQTLVDERETLIKKKAVLDFRIEVVEKQKNSSKSDEIEKLTLQKEILIYALNSLKQKRISLNKNILGKLEQLILKEIHAFGLNSIKEVKINDKHDLIFTQNEVSETFNDLSEGEKLRVKLAFYLSLIQLDIEHNLGRHPRFLIFDSPGSEEMIPEHLFGLSEILKSLDKRFGDKLQIFIGSALKEFSAITEPKKSIIKGKDEFIF